MKHRNELPDEILAAARHVELSRPESAAESFPKIQLLLCTLLVGACVGAAGPLLRTFGVVFFSIVPVVLGCLAAAFGQVLLVPMACLSLRNNASVRSFENFIVLVVSEAVYAYVLVLLVRW